MKKFFYASMAYGIAKIVRKRNNIRRFCDFRAKREKKRIKMPYKRRKIIFFMCFDFHCSAPLSQYNKHWLWCGFGVWIFGSFTQIDYHFVFGYKIKFFRKRFSVLNVSMYPTIRRDYHWWWFAGAQNPKPLNLFLYPGLRIAVRNGFE